MDKWIKKCAELEIPCTKHFKLYSTLTDSIEIRQWTLNGLPVDNFATENAIIVKNVQRYPLIIDPQGNMNKYSNNKKLYSSYSNNNFIIKFIRSSKRMDKEY